MPKQLITVREYARLTTDAVEPSLDRAQISASAFDYLCKLNGSLSKAGATLVHVEDRHWLCLDNYVGVLETPCGTRIEILPKHVETGDCILESRRLLCRMIQSAMELPTREVGTADLQLFDAPLSEWVMQKFLLALDHLVKRGVRFDYRRIEEETRFLRGQLDLVKQMRQPPGRQHHFQIRHDVFLPDRPENRLLKLALDHVCKTTQHPANWRLAHELRCLFIEVPASANIDEDFRQWRRDRLMAHYEPVKPWCELILNRQMPLAVVGDWKGISFLFPMEKLFESFVAAALRRALLPNSKLTLQAASRYLCRHDGGNIFQLKPDLLIRQGERQWVLDTKWKRLDSQSRSKNYDLSQTDFYQLFAYGQKYLNGVGDLVLIYPQRASFMQPLPVFEFSDQLRLWVLPFDLDGCRLIGTERAELPLHTANNKIIEKSNVYSDAI